MQKMKKPPSDLWDGERYHSNSKLQEKIALDFLAILQKRFPKFPPKTKFLDIGSGNGLITSLLPDFFPQIEIIGIDSSADMVRFANEQFKTSLLHFQQDNAETLNTIDDQSIDVAVSFSCLLWVHNLKSAFAAISRVLKPGGWIGLQFPAEDYLPCAIDDAYAQVVNEEHWKDYFFQKHQKVNWNTFDLKTIQQMLLDCGFKIETIQFAYWHFPFKDKTYLRNFLGAGLQQLKILPPHLQDSCLDRLVEIYLKKSASIQPKSGCIYDCNSLQIIGQRKI